QTQESVVLSKRCQRTVVANCTHSGPPNHLGCCTSSSNPTPTPPRCFISMNFSVPSRHTHPHGEKRNLRMTEAVAHLLALDYPAEFTPGARSAVTTCLRIDPAEKVTLITDRATESIAAALGAQLAERG